MITEEEAAILIDDVKRTHASERRIIFENYELNDRIAELTEQRKAARAERDDVIQERNTAIAQRDELCDILEELMDLQNGPPLPTYTKDWNATMDRGRATVAKVKDQQ